MKRGLQWPIAMGLVLALTVGANIWVAFVAGGDESFAVEKNYYARAVAWDSVMAQNAANTSLGWRLSPTLGAFRPVEGALLSVALADSGGAPISGATVRVHALYNARAAAVYEVTLTAGTAGLYQGALPVAHGGEWELRFHVQRGQDRFTSLSRVTAAPAPALE